MIITTHTPARFCNDPRTVRPFVLASTANGAPWAHAGGEMTFATAHEAESFARAYGIPLA